MGMDSASPSIDGAIGTPSDVARTGGKTLGFLPFTLAETRFDAASNRDRTCHGRVPGSP